jgi:hypothetical protein
MDFLRHILCISWCSIDCFVIVKRLKHGLMLKIPCIHTNNNYWFISVYRHRWGQDPQDQIVLCRSSGFTCILEWSLVLRNLILDLRLLQIRFGWWDCKKLRLCLCPIMYKHAPVLRKEERIGWITFPPCHEQFYE